MDCSIQGLPVPLHLLEFVQVHFHCISDAIQSSHPLTPSFPSALNLSQHQGLFQWCLFTSDGQNTGASASASVLSMNMQDWFPLGFIDLISLQSKGLSGVFSSTTSKSINSLVLSFLYGPTLSSVHDYKKNHSFDYMDLYRQWCFCFLICCLGLS